MLPEPFATYRLQLNPEFGFRQAADQLPYLSSLGISHVYTSPYLQAASRSDHGYDVVDPAKINAQLGGEKQHQHFSRMLKAKGLGHMLDLVPNHMAIAGRENPWWWDVLENGPSSPYASFFDVDWESSEDRWPNKILLPVLGDQYGRVLEAGEIKLSRSSNKFALYCGPLEFPVDPSSIDLLLDSAAQTAGSNLLAFMADCCRNLTRPTVTSHSQARHRHRNKEVIQQLLADLSQEEQIQNAIDQEVQRINRDPDSLDQLMERQNYRLAFWRTGNREIGYRRFFDINDLVALRTEDETVFAATHALPLSWVRQNTVQALRIDHPDGLRDPAGYFFRLRSHCPKAWIVAEKILAPHEKLPSDWPIQGTCGYDFLYLTNNLFIHPQAEAPLTSLYAELTKDATDYATVAEQARLEVVQESLGGDLKRLAALFVHICENHRRHRDYSRQELEQVLLMAAASFPVYRTYVSTMSENQETGPATPRVSPEDRQFINQAVSRAKTRDTSIDPELFDFLEKLLALEIPGRLEQEMALRFQQFTAPAMAKGVEDTAFYRYNRMICLNEVGGDPGNFGISLEHFHEQGLQAQADRPLSLLAGSTHDSKRGEDVRARLAVLSEIPEDWSRTVRQWFSRNLTHHSGSWPDANMEYFIYQTLVGAWPISSERLDMYLEKAMREAKVHTSWTRQNQEYEQGVKDFALSLLEDQDFLAELEEFLQPVIAAGRINSLSQVLLRLTFPGVPDIYQGSELWNLSLVDPDNRCPVDFDLRRRLLDQAGSLRAEQTLARMEEGMPKLWLIHRVLEYRRAHPEPFRASSSYQPLWASGPGSGQAAAFIRGSQVMTIVPRFTLKQAGREMTARINIPSGLWKNIFTEESFAQGSEKLSTLLARFPVACLVREE
ncbi:MAG: malto-oligosyltrehalose synthase [Desulfonatronovibrionaceae bacterium]